MNKNSLALTCALLLCCATLFAAAAPIELKAGTKLTAQGSSKLQLETVTSGGQKIVADVPATFTDELTLDDDLIAKIKQRMSPAAGARSSLLLSDANNRVIERFAVAAAAPAIDASRVVTNTPTAPIAGFAECKAAARAWQDANKDDWQDGKNRLLVLFNHKAALCYRSNLSPHQGDTIWTGFVYTDDVVVDRAAVDLSQCSDRSPEPNILVTGDIKGLVAQAGGKFAVHIASSDRCWDNQITLTASMKLKDVDAVQEARTVSFYPRYQATLQVGVLYTDLHEADFGLRDSGGQNVIYNKEESSTGPEYVASMVFYGLPNYFLNGGLSEGYHGRDIVNENTWADRTGLMILAGIQDPGDRFGVGVSFELGYGINIFVAHQWFKRRQLVGLQEGDVFAGDADTIPTKKDWEDETTVGLSFDIRYLTTLFKGQ